MTRKRLLGHCKTPGRGGEQAPGRALSFGRVSRLGEGEDDSLVRSQSQTMAPIREVTVAATVGNLACIAAANLTA